MTEVFYPILYGTFTAKGTGTSVLVKSKLNEIGLVLTTIIYSIVAYAIITGIVIQVDNSFNFLIRRAGIAFLLFLFFSSFPIILYRHIRSRVLEFLTAELQLKKDPR